MRVIAGKARRLALKTVPGMETRPTTAVSYTHLTAEENTAEMMDAISRVHTGQITYAAVSYTHLKAKLRNLTMR